MSYFYTPWKRQKTFGFLTISWGIEIGRCRKKGSLGKNGVLSKSLFDDMSKVVISSIISGSDEWNNNVSEVNS